MLEALQLDLGVYGLGEHTPHGPWTGFPRMAAITVWATVGAVGDGTGAGAGAGAGAHAWCMCSSTQQVYPEWW